MITAEEYIKTKKRICDFYLKNDQRNGGCGMCELSSIRNHSVLSCDRLSMYYPKEAIAIVEKWGKEQPVVTNRQKFKEVFGIEPLSNDQNTYICPPVAINGHCGVPCEECQKWWDEEWKEPGQGGRRMKAEGNMKEPINSLKEFIECLNNTATEICDKYCKYPNIICEEDSLIDDACSKCPLNNITF